MGGTFDPFHNGHLGMAIMAAFKIKDCKIVIVPSYNPPHKDEENITSYDDRFAMANLAIENYKPYITISNIEEMLYLKNKKPSYIVETLKKIRIEEETNQIGLLIGEDSLKSLEKWKCAEEILAYNNIFVVPREGCGTFLSIGMSSSIRNIIENSDLLKYYRKNIKIIEMAICNNTSSTEIRDKISNNNYEVDVPKHIVDYIKNKKLY